MVVKTTGPGKSKRAGSIQYMDEQFNIFVHFFSQERQSPMRPRKEGREHAHTNWGGGGGMCVTCLDLSSWHLSILSDRIEGESEIRSDRRMRRKR